MTTNNEFVLRNFAIIRVLSFINNPKDLDPSCKMDLDFWNCFGRKTLRLITEEIRYQKYQLIIKIPNFFAEDILLKNLWIQCRFICISVCNALSKDFLLG